MSQYKIIKRELFVGKPLEEEFEEFEKDINDFLYLLDWFDFEVSYFSVRGLHDVDLLSAHLLFRRIQNPEIRIFRQVERESIVKEKPEIKERIQALMEKFKIGNKNIESVKKE